VNPKIEELAGLLYGNPPQLASQILVSLTVLVYVCAVTAAIAKLIDKTIGWRVPEEVEYVGLDIAIHGERIRTKNIIDILPLLYLQITT